MQDLSTVTAQHSVLVRFLSPASLEKCYNKKSHKTWIPPQNAFRKRFLVIHLAFGFLILDTSSTESPGHQPSVFIRYTPRFISFFFEPHYQKFESFTLTSESNESHSLRTSKLTFWPATHTLQTDYQTRIPSIVRTEASIQRFIRQLRIWTP